jgi:hypothetical protein
MEETVRRLTRILGAMIVESSGHETTFAVHDEQGAQLRCTLSLASQHLMAVLVDPRGTTRCSLDLGPVTEAFERPELPGRVTLRVGHQLVHLDGQPSVGLEVESIPVEDRDKSQRLLLARHQTVGTSC